MPGATKVTGRYDEKDDKTGKVTKVKERSHVVTSGKMGKRKFKKAVKALGKKYDQDAVITQTKGGGGATLKRTRKGALPKRNIPIGKVSTYGDVATLAGHPNAWRAVGNIMRNCSSPAIPCHRVVKNQAQKLPLA